MRKHQELSLEQIIKQVRVDEYSSDDFASMARRMENWHLIGSIGYQNIRMS